MAIDTVLVNNVSGNAWVRQADGSLLALRAGMRVPANAEVVTDSGANVELQADGMNPFTVGESRQLQVSDELANADVDPSGQTIPAQLDPDAARVLAALQAGEDPFAQLDPTAAVNSGGGGDDGGSSFTRLVSVVETTTPLALAYPKPVTPSDELPRMGGYGRDEGDPTLVTGTSTVTLEAPKTVVEGEPYEVVARVDRPVTGQDLVITLTNGSTITIPVGETEGRTTVDNPYPDDVYKQGDRPEDIGISGTTGGNYESLDTSSTTTTTVKDDSDKTTITLESPTDVVEGTDYDIIARVDNPVTGKDLVITLDNGKTITIPVGGSEGKVTITPRDDDAYKQGDEPVTVGITGTEGGNYENLTYDGSDVTTKVVDDTDEVIATLNAVGQPTLGAEITYQVTLTNKDNLPIDRHGKITVTLDSGKVIDIPAGGTTGSITFKLTQAGALTDGIKSVVVDGDVQFEKLTSTGVIDLNVTNIAPTVGEGKAVVSEEGLPGGIKDSQGSSDTTDKTLVTGKLAISDPDSNNLTVKLVAPEGGNIKSGGIAVTWTVEADGTLVGKAGDVEVIKASIDNEGNYKIELKAPVDHPVKGQEDTLDFHIGVEVSDETSTVDSKIVVTIEDDSPVATHAAETLTVPVSEIVVNGLQGGFINPKFQAQKGATDSRNKDTDLYYEELRWGAKLDKRGNLTSNLADNPSGYDYFDNSVYRNNSDNLLGSTFKLGEFKHINFPSYGKTLVSTDLVVKFNVTIDGVVHQIEHTIKLRHTETPNDGNDRNNRDIVEIDAATLTKTFTVGDRTFEFTIDGFKNHEYGDPVSTVLTWENAVNTFDLYATISAVDDMPKIEGKLDGNLYSYGADGAATGGQGVVWENAVKQSDGSYKIVNEFGIFIGKSDGSYTFEMSRDARDKMIVNDLKDMTFKYSVTDQDGDSATADLTITLKGQPNNAPEEAAFRTALAVEDTSEVVIGTDDHDSLVGTDGDDILFGGAGDDILTGGLGDDIFVWTKGDVGTGAKPAVDHVTDFGVGNDTLDISDLLPGNGGSLDSYLDVRASADGKIEIQIATQGSGQVDQKIILDNMDYTRGKADEIKTALKDGILKADELSDFDAETANRIANSLKDGSLKSSDF